MKSDQRSTTKLINMHEAYKVLATRWPPSVNCHKPSRGLVLSLLLTIMTRYQITSKISGVLPQQKAPIPVLTKTNVLVLFSRYDNIYILEPMTLYKI